MEKQMLYNIEKLAIKNKAFAMGLYIYIIYMSEFMKTVLKTCTKIAGMFLENRLENVH